MGVSKNRGTPKWMVKIMENPIKMGWFGGKTHYFWKHPYDGRNPANSPVEGGKGSLSTIIYRGFSLAPSKRWLALGFLKHQSVSWDEFGMRLAKIPVATCEALESLESPLSDANHWRSISTWNPNDLKFFESRPTSKQGLNSFQPKTAGACHLGFRCLHFVYFFFLIFGFLRGIAFLRIQVGT